MSTEPAPAKAHARARRRLQAWIAAAVLLIAALAYFAWAGAAKDPRTVLPWTWTKTGWLVPAPGLTQFLLAAAALLTLLSLIAWFLSHPVPRSTTLKPWAGAAAILILAILVRIAIAAAWIPLPLDPRLLALRALPSATPGRWFAAAIDMLAVGLLVLALAGRRRSVWWAALYAFHPLVLREITGNGNWIAAIVAAAVIFLAGVGHRIRLPMRIGISAALAVAATIAITWALAVTGPSGFNSLAFAAISLAGVHTWLALPLAAALGFAAVIALSIKCRWPLERTLAHLFVIALLCSPDVKPWYVVPLAALVPLAWNPGAWALSIMVLGSYVAVALPGRRAVPETWLMLEWIPVLVLECDELLRAAGKWARAWKAGKRGLKAATAVAGKIPGPVTDSPTP